MVGETRLGGKNGGGLVKFRKVTRCRLKNLNSSEVGGLVTVRIRVSFDDEYSTKVWFSV